MCRAQCVLALVAMYVGVAHSSSWDFATFSELHNDLEFYFRGQKTHTENISSGGIREMTYDPVGNRMFFFDSTDMFYFMYSYDMTTKKTVPLVIRPHKDERVEGIAFDPVEQILFWIVYYRSPIYWFSLKPGSHNNVTGNVLIETTSHGTPTIAIDSCNGYIYWTNIDVYDHKLPSLIERARFDGSGREVVISTGLQMPERLVIDPQTQRLYWTDGTQYVYGLPPIQKKFSIESANLNGENRIVIYSQRGQDQPNSITVSEDYIYWSHWDEINAWQLAKNVSKQTKPKIMSIRFYDKIMPSYKIEQQLQGVHNCDRLKNLLQNDTLAVENNSLDVTTDASMYYVHETTVSGKSQSKCRDCYVGEQCDVSVCHNYCFQGSCSTSDKGEPQCSCDSGYSGQRCEVNVCQGYCLNAGECHLNEENAPICQCRADYEGERCEVSACLNRLNKYFQTVSMLRNVLNAESPGILDRGVKSTCAANIF